MTNIYQLSLDAKFRSIMEIVAREIGYSESMTALTADRRMIVQNLAEQSIINWAVERKTHAKRRVPITNLQHLLDEYCALADHL